MSNQSSETIIRRFLLFPLALFVVTHSSQLLRAQDPISIAPKIQKVIFENDIMRVTRAIYKPGEGIGMHEHGKGLVIALTDFNVQSTLANDSSTTIVKKAGSVWWREPMKHILVNTGKQRLEIIEIELKDTANHEPMSLSREPLRIDPKHFKLEIDNDYIHVVRFHLDSLATSPMHGHLQRLTVNLTDVQSQVTMLDGKKEKQTSKAGEIQWKPAEVHAIRNLRKKPIEIISIEVKVPTPSISPNVLLKRHVLDSTEICYIEKGKGAPVVLVHGELEDFRVWDAQINALAKKYSVIAYSRRYHYPNEWKGNGLNYSIQLHVEDLKKFLEKIKRGRVHLIGHSDGGTVALIAGLLYPKLVRSVVTADGAFPSMLSATEEGKELLKRRSAIEDSTRQAFNKGHSLAGIRTFTNFAFGEDSFEQLPTSIKNIILDNASSLGYQIRSTVRVPWVQCRNLQQRKPPPIFIVEGAMSPAYYHKAIDEFVQCVPKAQRYVIPNASHGMIFTHPEAFNLKVMEFLSKFRR